MSRETLMLIGALAAAATVLLGAYLARRAALGRAGPLAAGLAHAALGLATVSAVTLAAFSGETAKLLNAALLFFGFALIGGLFVLVFRLQGEPPPLFMVYLHAASAVLAICLLGLALPWGSA